MKHCSEIKMLLYVWFSGGGGRSSIQLTDGTDAVTAGGGGGGAYCVDGCGGGGKKHFFNCIRKYALFRSINKELLRRIMQQNFIITIF